MKRFQKIVARLSNIAFVVLALPFAAGFLLLYPVIRVRFGLLFADRIGHFAFDSEFYLTKIHRFEGAKLGYDIFFFEGKICNNALAEIISRHVSVTLWARPIYRALSIWPRNPAVLEPARKVTGSRDPEGFFIRTESILFSEDWMKAFESADDLDFLRQLGVSENSKIACLIVRDSAYLASRDRSRNWDYHKYRDTPICLYEQVAFRLAEMGYFVFRMGKVVEESFAVRHERVIDYAKADWKSDFLDLWLIAQSSFCISTSTGLDSVADVCRKPLALVNFLPLAYFQTWSNSVLAPCNLVWQDTGKSLTCVEHLMYSFQRTEDYQKSGINIMPLSSDQITKVVLELEKRISGHWSISESELQRQRRFREMFCVPDHKLLEQSEVDQIPSASGWLGSRSRPDEVVNTFHPQAILSERFLEDYPEFLNPQKSKSGIAK